MNKIFLLIIAIVINLSGCKLDKKADNQAQQVAYKPYGLDITYANWEYKLLRKKEFENFTVTLTNETKENFRMVRFRIKLFIKENEKERLVFSKSYEYNQRLNAGDVIRIPITDLSGFYLGVDISENKNFSFESFIEDSEIIK